MGNIYVHGGQKYSPCLKSVFPAILQTFSCTTGEATIMKKYQNKSTCKWMFVINIFIVVFCCLLFSYTNRFNTEKNKMPFSTMLTLSVNREQIILKIETEILRAVMNYEILM